MIVSPTLMVSIRYSCMINVMIYINVMFYPHYPHSQLLYKRSLTIMICSIVPLDVNQP